MRTELQACVAGILWAAFFGLFVNAFQLIVPLYMLQVYDRVIVSQSIDTLVMLTLLAIGCLVFLGCIDYIRARLFIVLGENLTRRLSIPTLQAAITRSLQLSSTQSSQSMRDLHELRQFVTTGPVALPLDALFVPLFFTALVLLHPAYGAVAAGGAVVFAVLSVAMEFLVRRPSQAANEAALKSHAEVGAAIRHAELIESMGMLGAIARRWQSGQNGALRKVGAGNARTRAILAISRSSRMGIQILMLATGAVLVIDQLVTPGTIVASTIIMSRVLFPFEQLIDGWRHWSQAIGAYRRLTALFAEAGSPRRSERVEVHDARLVVEGLGFVPSGGDRAVLRGISCVCEPGEVLGVTGASGAGKSTLARHLVGVVSPTAGGIYLDGQNVFTWERASFGRAVGYLPQSAMLLDGTVGENIARFQDTDPAEVIAAARRVGAHEMIGRLPFGYQTRVGEGGFGLSGGQRQRIALARAFFGRPRLIVLDEPNTYLDAEGEAALTAAIRDAKGDGAAVVVVTHRPVIIAAADKLLQLRDGAVEAYGPTDQVTRFLEQGTARAAPRGGVVTQLPVRRAKAP